MGNEGRAVSSTLTVIGSGDLFEFSKRSGISTRANMVKGLKEKTRKGTYVPGSLRCGRWQSLPCKLNIGAGRKLSWGLEAMLEAVGIGVESRNPFSQAFVTGNHESGRRR